MAGLLPSTTIPGTYAVRVTYNGQSSAQATIGNINGGLSLTRFTSGSVAFSGYTWTLAPAHPGDTLVLRRTGGGANPLNDTGGTSGDQAAAASRYLGLWQINFTLPSAIAPDCFAYVQVGAGGQLSNAVSIPIAAAGAYGHRIRRRSVQPLLSFGMDSAILDAGPKLALSGPNVPHGVGAGLFVGPIGPAYSNYLPSGTLVNGGTYTLTGPGGAQVGPFTATATLPSSFAVTNWNSLTAILTSATTHDVVVSCAVPASLGTFSIPAAALAYLPPTAGLVSNVGQLSVTAGANGGTVTAVSTSARPLTPSLVGGGQVDFGSFAPLLAVARPITVQ